MGLHRMIIAAAGFALMPMAAMADSWGSWKHIAGSMNNVSLEARARYTRGDTEVQWRIHNNTPNMIYGSVRNKIYTYGDGTTTSASDEGSNVPAWSHETFMPDTVRGEIRWMEADLNYD